MAQNSNRTRNQVRVDYKNTTSPATPAEESIDCKESGNGRIRKCLALGCIAIIGTTTFKMVFSGTNNPTAAATQRELPAAPSATAETKNSQPPASNIMPVMANSVGIESIQPQFFFNSIGSTQPLDQPVEDVPFLEVDRIDDFSPEHTDNKISVSNPVPLTAAAPELANDYSQEPSELLVTVKQGDTLSALLSNHGLTAKEIAELAAIPEVNDHLVNIRAGQEIRVDLDGSRRLTGLTREIDLARTLTVTREADSKFSAKIDVQPLEKRVRMAELTMDTSLFIDGAKAGLAESVIMELYSIFQWTVDFNREVRAGDRLLVLHEAFYKNGEKVKDGNIVAAEYHSADNMHSAFRHVSNGKTGYYDSQGQSLKKQFLRNPIKARITSRFNLKRKHPIRHTIRAHKGVDYGAPTGTPISAAGDGRIIFAGVKGTYGNTVEIQHGDRHTTLYAHLSKFPKGLKKGDRVKQGEVIGYVGRTGLATGPHLHYEFRIDGIHYDPQKVKLGGSTPLNQLDMLAFKENIEPLRGQLASMRTIAKAN